MSSTTSGQPSTIGLKRRDSVVDEIEKFMYECENMITGPLTICKGKIYDTENLLDILDSESNNKNSSIKKINQCVVQIGPVNKVPKIQNNVSPKKRKLREKSEDTPSKTIKTDNKSVKKKNENLGRPRGRSRNNHKLQFAKSFVCIEPKLISVCERPVTYWEKFKAERLYYCKSHSATAKVVEIKNDSKVVPSVVIKQEIIDLTSEEDSYYMCLNFGKIYTIQEPTFHMCEVLEKVRKVKVVEVISEVNTASEFMPDVRIDLTQSVIDLTEFDNDENSLTIISEKECANKILFIIYKFHKAYQVNKKMEGALNEVRSWLSTEEASEDYYQTLSFISKRTKIIGRTLVQRFENHYMKNLNVTRFLEIVVCKLKQKYKLSISTSTVALYLQLMLNQNREYCKNQLLKDFLKQTNEYLTVKLENGDSADYFLVVDAGEVFTQNQLDQLEAQINAYNLIARYQVELMAEYNLPTIQDLVQSYHQRTSGQPSTIGLKRRDSVVDEIEKFMYECENMITGPLTICKGKIYDTENLLDILDSESNNKNSSIKKINQCVVQIGPVNKVPKIQNNVSPKKRKLREKSEDTPSKTIKTDNKSVKKKNENLGRPRGRSRNNHKLQFAKSFVCIEPKLISVCERPVTYWEKFKAERLYYCKSHSATAKVVEIKNDSKVVPSVVIKQEIIDLTSEEDSYYMCLNFGKIYTIQEPTFHMCEVLEKVRKVKVVEVISEVNTASEFMPDVRIDLTQSVIDLTEFDNDENSLTIISEKECANKILFIIYKFHKAYQVNKKMEGALNEVRSWLSTEEASEDYYQTLSFISKRTKIIGRTLVQRFENHYMKNLNVTRFLEIVVCKLKQKYKLSISTSTVALYLQLMLNQNREYCKNQLLKDFLKQTNEYLTVKLENGDSADYFLVVDAGEVFTQNQLDQLEAQINAYNLIARYQVELMAEYNLPTIQDLVQSYHQSFTTSLMKELDQGEFNFQRIKNECPTRSSLVMI